MIIADSSPCSHMTSRFNDLLVSMEKLLKRFPCLGWFGWLYFEFLLALFSFLPIGYCDYLGLLYQDTQSKSAHLCSLPKLSLCDQHPILDPSLWMIQMCTLYPGETNQCRVGYKGNKFRRLLSETCCQKIIIHASQNIIGQLRQEN